MIAYHFFSNLLDFTKIVENFMINGIRQQTTVKQTGRIEILSPELQIGTTVEVIVLLEPSEKETQTERWLRLSADDKQLETARKEFAAKQWVELKDDDDLDALLKK